MKKLEIVILILIIIVLIITFTIVDSIGVKELTCTAKGKSSDIKTSSKLEIKVKNQKIKDMKFTLDMILPKDQQNQKEDYINMVRQTKPYMSASVIDNGVRFVTKMQNGSFIGIDADQEMTISELKEVLEVQGYSCK